MMGNVECVIDDVIFCCQLSIHVQLCSHMMHDEHLNIFAVNLAVD
jgi:hypothetical protein